VRTGGLSFNVGAPGTANCATWTNSIATNVGTTVRLVSDWSPASVVISPWSAQTYTCNLTHRSWCVED
jgi:hypothetical protein